MSQLVPIERIEQKIFLLRGQKVMLDSDLAELYGVNTKVLNQAVKRNRERFPEDFMFQLTPEEAQNLKFHFGTSSSEPGLRSQNVTLKHGRGQHRKYLPFVFTEQGVAMLSSVLKSRRAALVNVAIMRAFVKLRQMLASHRGLARQLEALEKKYDVQFRMVFDAIRELMRPSPPSRKQIGFKRNQD